MVQGVTPSNGEYLTLKDIQRKVVLSDDVHKCPTRVISLENTVAGLVHPLSEMRRISRWAREQDVKLHLDGARLWVAVAAGAGTIEQYAECFDSVALDFSNGLGAPTGAIIVGNARFVAQARRIREGLGGGIRQAGVLSAAAMAAVDDMFRSRMSTTEWRADMRKVHYHCKRVAHIWVRNGGQLLRRVETNIIWVDLRAANISVEEFKEIGSKFGVKVDGARIALHYQISEEAMKRLEKMFVYSLGR